MSTTARRRFWTPSATRASWPARPAASPSTSARRWWRSTASRSRSSTRRATRRSRPCAPAAPRSPTSSCWWWPPTTASCRRPSRPSTTRRRPRCPSWWPSTRSTSRARTPTACARSWWNTASFPRSGAAPTCSWRCRPSSACTSTTCWRRSSSRPTCWSSRPTPTPRPPASSSRRTSTRVAVPWPPCSCSAARCTRATSWWPAPRTAVSARWWIRMASTSIRPVPPIRWRSWA